MLAIGRRSEVGRQLAIKIERWCMTFCAEHAARRIYGNYAEGKFFDSRAPWPDLHMQCSPEAIGGAPRAWVTAASFAHRLACARAYCVVVRVARLTSFWGRSAMRARHFEQRRKVGRTARLCRPESLEEGLPSRPLLSPFTPLSRQSRKCN